MGKEMVSVGERRTQNGGEDMIVWGGLEAIL